MRTWLSGWNRAIHIHIYTDIMWVGTEGAHLLGSLKASGLGCSVTSPRGSSPTTSTVAPGAISATYSAMRAVRIAVLFQAASMCASPCACATQPLTAVCALWESILGSIQQMESQLLDGLPTSVEGVSRCHT